MAAVESLSGAPLLASEERVEDKAEVLRTQPFALTHSVAGGMRIAASNEPASLVSVEPGQLLADARALYPELMLAEADEAADDKALTGLAEWLGRYTPWTAASTQSSGPHNGTDGIYLDITGCAHLFGPQERGEQIMMDDIMMRLRDFEIEARAGLADSAGAAWAVAHYAHLGAHEFHITPEGGQKQAIAHLPVAALRLSQENTHGLHAMGLKKIHQLFKLPRAPLTARFGTDVAHRLDQALGIDDEPISPRKGLVPYRVRKVLAEPLSTIEAISEGVKRLSEDLVERFLIDRKGARRLTLTLYRVDGKLMRLKVGTSQVTNDAAHMTRLIVEKLDDLHEDFDAGFGIDVMMLAAPVVEDKTPAQESLAGIEAGQSVEVKGSKKKPYPTFSRDLTRLLDRLGNRFGEARVYQMTPEASHIPERAQRQTPVMALEETRLRGGGLDWHRPTTTTRPMRPLTMLPRAEPIEVLAEVPDGPPKRFRWRRVNYQIVKTLGPERIAPEWWKSADLTGQAEGAGRTRDYFQAEDQEGRRFWLFRNGLYERETNSPEWYVHGVFG